MREDTFTNTEADAGDYEHWRGGGYEPNWDAPSPSDLAHDAEEDRRAAKAEREAEERAHAAGVYVPDTAMKITTTMIGLTLIQRGLFGCRVVAVRDGVSRIDGLHNLDDPLFKGDTFDPARYEFTVVDGVVWCKGKWTGPGPAF